MRTLFLVIILFSVIWMVRAFFPVPGSGDAPSSPINSHRTDFVCQLEANIAPPLDPEADVWYREAMRSIPGNFFITVPPDIANTLSLLERAAERKHWKAMTELAKMYFYGLGVPRDTDKAEEIVDEAMNLGIPAAYNLKGEFHMKQYSLGGVQLDYLYWQKAAGMGNPDALTRLAVEIRTPPAGSQVEANIQLATKMLECAYGQGNGEAAYELGRFQLASKDPEIYAQGLGTLHKGVEFGSIISADILRREFDNHRSLKNSGDDQERASRYLVFEEALKESYRRRFPNLDKVLPLPPAPLPQWDGNKAEMIKAAM